MAAGHARVLVPLLALSGCVDPGGEFDAFAKRAGSAVRPDAATGDGATCALSPGSVGGKYLLALSVTLAPTKPITALTDVSTPALGDGVGVAFSAQPLSAADRSTPVGAPLSLGPYPVAPDGSFRADMPGLEVPGAANPVTGGDIAADVVLSGNLCGDGRFFCGILTGAVSRPLPLDLSGSTFTLTRVEGEPTNRPAIDCAGDLADPP